MMSRTITKEMYVSVAKSIHGDLYDYSDTVFVDMRTPITIKSKAYSEFTISPLIHLTGSGRKNSCKITTERFITVAKLIHGEERYDYSETVYVKTSEKVKIKCNKCGEIFYQTPSAHLAGEGCSCNRYNTVENIQQRKNNFIKKSKEKFGDKFDYSKVVYEGKDKPIILICNIHHQEFTTTPGNHLQSNNGGCPECIAEERKIVYKNRKSYNIKNTEDFIRVATELCGDKFDYSKVDYKGMKKNIIIICNECGEEFLARPDMFLRRQRCPLCYKKSNSMTTERFIKEVSKKYGDKYDYSQVVYVNSKTPIKITCKKHNYTWEVAPYSFLNGSGCPLCGNERKSDSHKHSTEKFIELARKVHGDKYDYSQVNYINIKTDVIIICPKHDAFKLRPDAHLNGLGCSKCALEQKESNISKEVKKLLIDNNINYIPEKKFDWLKYKRNLRLDYYLPDYNIAIECQGGEHFFNVDIWGGIKAFNESVIKDKKKYTQCNEHNIPILYYTDKEYVKDYELGELIIDLDILLQRIQSYPKIE